MASMHFDTLDQMPAGMRRLVEQQLASAAWKKPRAAAAIEEAVAAQGQSQAKKKYHNLPTERLLPNGNVIKFRSLKEAKFFDELKAKEKFGIVRNIRMEVQYLLKPAYTDSETGERYRAINYLADFVYEEKEADGSFRQHIIDTKGGSKKGTRTKDYAIKRKLMADKGYHIEEK